ncbi:hypothetical protein [Amycolatopsis sp. NPDC051061]|uniref:hypothetical protein n=1 Tax=Amycolatopsis sp. NPDC051061 TaxID=3155042 RepID=UPI003437098C
MSTAPACDRAQPGEVYVTVADSGVVFPAVIEDERWNRFARPRFNRTAAEAVVAWLNDCHGAGATAAAFDGEAVAITATTADRAERIEPGDDGRYPIGAGAWEWELTMPAADISAEQALLAGAHRLTPEIGETPVTINATGSDPAFPAQVDPVTGWSRSGIPRFRLDVAVVIVAWLNACGRLYPGATVAYWEDSTIMLLDPLAATQDGYLPTRVVREADGRYAIGAGFEWERAKG